MPSREPHRVGQISLPSTSSHFTSMVAWPEHPCISTDPPTHFQLGLQLRVFPPAVMRTGAPTVKAAISQKLRVLAPSLRTQVPAFLKTYRAMQPLKTGRFKRELEFLWLYLTACQRPGLPSSHSARKLNQFSRHLNWAYSCGI